MRRNFLVSEDLRLKLFHEDCKKCEGDGNDDNQ